jgi:ankyrin repeat protein
MKRKAPMTFERLMSRAFGGESSSFWRGGPRGLTVEDVRQYLDEGGDPNRRADSGYTLLHIAADNYESEIVRLLVERGADLNARGYCGYTPLHIAVDADCNTSSRDGRRATELPLTALLLGFGADESVRDEDGETARDFALAYGSQEAELYDNIPSRRSSVK